MFREASPEERKVFYEEEWNKKDLPDYIVESLEYREFGFDYRGEGPNDRYNKIPTPEALKKILKARYPYAVYASVAFYENPRKRENWIKAELVFDIDAKDLPVRSCSCKSGEVCEKCLLDAKEFVFLIKDALSDLGVKNINYVYSGRGYHIRILDEDFMKLDSKSRAKILEYVSASIKPRRLDRNIGYARVFKKRLIKVIQLAKGDEFSIDVGEVLKKKRKIANEIEENNFDTLRSLVDFDKFLEEVAKINASTVDARVTVDVKRILRLPSTLHSKVSMKCVAIKDLNKFDPFKHAVPKFVYERRGI